MGKFELSLAQNYVRDWTIVDAVREFFQNALDQEVEEADNKWFYVMDHTTGTLSIGNEKSVLTPQTLLLGTTSKENSENTVGQFGEGYKVGTLVAIRTGHPVTFYNYGKKEVWRPRMVKCKRYDGAEVLTFFTEKHIWTKVPDNNLTITIENITSNEWGQIRASNLHIDDCPEVHQTKYGRILKGKAFAGRIYVNGLYVRQEQGMEYGYDIIPKYLKLDRDRKAVSSFDLHWFTTQMWAQVNDPEAMIELAKGKSNDMRFLGTQTYTPVHTEVKSAACSSFIAEHGEKAIPVYTQSDLENAQRQYKDAKAIMVSESLKRLIVEAPEYKVSAIPQDKEPTKHEKLIIWARGVQDKLDEVDIQIFLDIMEIDTLEEEDQTNYEEEGPF